MRLSEKQRGFLSRVAASETPTDDCPAGLPLYLSHTFMQFQFNTEGERRRWFDNLQKRGLITLEKECFARLTELGRSAIAKDVA
jgi:hypothetical protein